jgi:hypothetical protein
MPVRDLDIWFPNQDVLDTFMASIKILEGVSWKRSYGGHAYDIQTKEWGPTIQVIAFRVGDPVEIISKFDFTNCAVALNEKGFWFQKEVPELLQSKKLKLQNDNSAYFSSRVYKYLQKGFHTLDETVQNRLFVELDSIADKGIALARNFDAGLAAVKSLREFDGEYKPMLTAVRKAESALSRFLNFTFKSRRKTDSETSIEVFRPDQKQQLLEKMNQIRGLLKSVSDVRTKTYDLPYGYEKASDPSERDLGDILSSFS